MEKDKVKRDLMAECLEKAEEIWSDKFIGKACRLQEFNTAADEHMHMPFRVAMSAGVTALAIALFEDATRPESCELIEIMEVEESGQDVESAECDKPERWKGKTSPHCAASGCKHRSGKWPLCSDPDCNGRYIFVTYADSVYADGEDDPAEEGKPERWEWIKESRDGKPYINGIYCRNSLLFEVRSATDEMAQVATAAPDMRDALKMILSKPMTEVSETQAEVLLNKWEYKSIVDALKKAGE